MDAIAGFYPTMVPDTELITALEQIGVTLENMLEENQIVKRQAGLKFRRGPIPINRHKHDSRCLLCGRIFYGKTIETCPNCGGLCRVCPFDELELSARHAHREGW